MNAVNDLTKLVMSICDCTSCFDGKPCEKVLKVVRKIRKIKVTSDTVSKKGAR